MLKAEQIPDEVVKAALLTDDRLGMREVIAAALNAWPGVTIEKTHIGISGDVFSQDIILPLPQKEKSE